MSSMLEVYYFMACKFQHIKILKKWFLLFDDEDKIVTFDYLIPFVRVHRGRVLPFPPCNWEVGIHDVILLIFFSCSPLSSSSTDTSSPYKC